MGKVTEFKLPDGLSDVEQKGLTAVAGWMTENFEKFASGQITQEALSETIANKLDELGLQKETLSSLKESLKTQGAVLASLKERALTGGVNISGLEASLDKNFDSLRDAVKSKKEITIKAADEHTADRIHTTSNIVIGGSGVSVVEMAGEASTLFLKRRSKQYIHDIANVTVVDEVPETYNFWEEGSEKGEIAIVEENGLKPQVHLSLVKNSVDAKKAAGYIAATEEVVKWRKRAWASIQRLFRDKVYRDYENKLTDQLLTDEATNYVGTPLDGTFEAKEVTDFTAIIAAISQLEALEYEPTTLVINPADKWRLALSQTGNGMFVLPYIQQGGKFGLIGLNVITTNKVPAGKFLIGDASTWYIEEEAPQLRTGMINDDFIHNRYCIVGEIFFLSYVPSNNKGSWIFEEFNTIKNALVKAEAAG